MEKSKTKKIACPICLFILSGFQNNYEGLPKVSHRSVDELKIVSWRGTSSRPQAVFRSSTCGRNSTPGACGNTFITTHWITFHPLGKGGRRGEDRSANSRSFRLCFHPPTRLHQRQNLQNRSLLPSHRHQTSGNRNHL